VYVPCVLESMPRSPPENYRRKEHEWKSQNAGILPAPGAVVCECGCGAGGGYGCQS